MKGIEWVGFFISALSVIFLIARAIYDGYQAQKNPSKYKAQQEEAERRFKEFLRGEAPPPPLERAMRTVIEEDEEDEQEMVRRREALAQKVKSAPKPAPVPPPNPVIPVIPEFAPSVEAPYSGYEKQSISRAKLLLRRESSPKNMVVLHEIYGIPKGLRE